MKALLVSEYGALNGGEFSFLAALPKLHNAGFEFTAALPADSDFADLLRKNKVRIEPFSFHHNGQRKEQSRIREDLHHLIETTRPAIVHANSLAAARILGPVTANLPAVGLGYLRDIIKLSRKAIADISQLESIVAVSRATAHHHIAAGLPENKVEVIHNGVDLERFFPAETILANANPVCLCIGQLGMRKGVDLTLRIAARVFRQIEKAELWIVGQRHSTKDEAVAYEQQLHEFAKSNFDAGQVKWLGRRADIPDLMRQADVLVHAARQEPLGRVLLEAAASGLPIITTNVGGTPEILAGLEELMFSPHDFDLAAPTLVELLTDARRHQEVARKLRQIAEQHFSAKRAGEDLVDCYLRATQTGSVG